MRVVTAYDRVSGALEYVSQPLPSPEANMLAATLRRHTALRIEVEDVTGRQSEIEVQPAKDAN